MSDLQKRTAGLDWEALRLVLEIDRHGSLSGAARALGVRHSTVFRRLAQLEAVLGTRLFERQREGYVSNAQGEALVEAARSMEQAAFEAERRVFGADRRLSGIVRLATSEALGSFLVAPLLDAFSRLHPDIEVELLIENRSVDLARHEADLALRATSTPPESMVGRSLATLSFAVYGTSRFVPPPQAPIDLTALPWLGFDGTLRDAAQARCLRALLPDLAPRLRFDSLPVMAQAARHGAGVAALTCFVAAELPELVRLAELDPGYFPTLWLLHHPDLRRSARVRALAGFLGEHIPRSMEAARERIRMRSPSLQPTAGVPAQAPRKKRRRA